MSAKLAPIDLAGAVVGTTGVIDFNQFTKFQANNIKEKAHLRVMNESGCGVDVVFKASGNAHYLPAGAWGTFDVEPNDATLNVTVDYILPNPPVSRVVGIYYMPGETVPQSFTLGNSPIGIGGTIATGNVTLSNEGNPINTLFIDGGPAGNLNMIQIFNDHFIWSVVQSGVAHQVLKGNITGDPLQLGQVGDNTTVLGVLVSPSVSSNNYRDSAGNDGMVITPGNVTRIASSTQVALLVGGSAIVGVTAALVAIVTNVSASGHTIDADSFQLDNSGSFKGAVGSWSRRNTATYAGSGTGQLINHGLGAAPTCVLLCPQNGASTTTAGADTYTSTQFTASTASAMTMRFYAWRS